MMSWRCLAPDGVLGRGFGPVHDLYLHFSVYVSFLRQPSAAHDTGNKHTEMKKHPAVVKRGHKTVSPLLIFFQLKVWIVQLSYSTNNCTCTNSEKCPTIALGATNTIHVIKVVSHNDKLVRFPIVSHFTSNIIYLLLVNKDLWFVDAEDTHLKELTWRRPFGIVESRNSLNH